MILTTLLLLFPQAGDLQAAMASARSQAESGDFAAAVATLEEAQVRDSSNAEAATALGTYLLRLAETQIASGQISGLQINDAFLEAAYVLEDAVKLEGAPPLAHENLAEALLNGGDKRNALRAIEAGVKAHPKQASSLMQRARVQVALANDTTDEKKKKTAFDAAVADYRAAMKADKNNAQACMKTGETIVLAAYALGTDLAAARKSAAKPWKEALKRNQSEVNLSMMCQWLHSEAVPLLKSIDRSNGKDATMAWYMGYAEYCAPVETRSWDEVRKHFEHALELQPTMHNAQYFLAEGAFYEGARIQALGEDTRAANAFRYSAKRWANYLETSGEIHRGTVYAAADQGATAIDQLKWIAGKAVGYGDFDSGISISKWITTAAPNDVEAWNNLAFLYRDSGQAEKSLAAYAKAAELAPEDPQVLNDWAVIYHYYLKTEDAKARKLYEDAITLAEEILANEVGLSEADQQRIQVGLRDARNNLRKLNAGNRTNG